MPRFCQISYFIPGVKLDRNICFLIELGDSWKFCSAQLWTPGIYDMNGRGLSRHSDELRPPWHPATRVHLLKRVVDHGVRPERECFPKKSVFEPRRLSGLTRVVSTITMSGWKAWPTQIRPRPCLVVWRCRLLDFFAKPFIGAAHRGRRCCLSFGETEATTPHGQSTTDGDVAFAGFSVLVLIAFQFNGAAPMFSRLSEHFARSTNVPRPQGRIRRRFPRIEGLEERCLLSGISSITEIPRPRCLRVRCCRDHGGS